MIVLSALGTFAIWAIIILGSFIVSGAILGLSITRWIPPHQERMPRHLAFSMCIASAILAAGPAAFQVGATQATLALGDAWAFSEPRVITPKFGDDWYARLVAEVRQEIEEIKKVGVLEYAVSYVALGSIRDGIQTVRSLAQGYNEAGRWKKNIFELERIRHAWMLARADLAKIARRKIAGSLLFALAYWAGMIALGGLLILVSRSELKRISRAIAARQD